MVGLEGVCFMAESKTLRIQALKREMAVMNI